MLRTAVAVLILLACYLASGPRWQLMLISPTLLTTTLFSKTLLSSTNLPFHVGIAAARPSLTTYSIAVAGAIIASLLLYRGLKLILVLPFIIVCLIYMFTVWHAHALQWSGFMSYGLAAGIWCVAYTVGADGRNKDAVESTLAFLLMLIGATELVVSIPQSVGVSIPLYRLDQTAADFVYGRVNGTTDHPDTLGKIIFLLLILALPLTRSACQKTRRHALFAILLMLYPLAASQGRANFIAFLLVIVIWAALSPRQHANRSRAVLLTTAVLLAVVSASIYLARFAQDPSGGARNHFLAVAGALYPTYKWQGMAPNSYVEVAGQFDALTAQGWPVHNAFLLMLLELGYVVTLTAWLPIAFAITRLLIRATAKSSNGEWARSALASLPGLFLIAYTGWGILAKQTIILLALSYGFAYGRSALVTRAEPDITNQHEPGLRMPAQLASERSIVAPYVTPFEGAGRLR